MKNSKNIKRKDGKAQRRYFNLCVFAALRFNLFVFLLCSTFLNADPVFVEDKVTIPILSPAFNDQKIAKIRLDNGLEVYLVSDPTLDRSAAALSVEAGSWFDPPNHQGMAHFLEHMLFLATKKYPVESEFDHFLKLHGGKTNAYTSDSHTVFAFEVNKDGFPEALDRFASFFQEPLLSPLGVSREVNAINHEFAGKSEDDDFRAYFVMKHLANARHPYHQNNAGNRVSLANTSTEDLRQWYLNYYSADGMHLIVKSQIGLEALKQMVISSFSNVPTRPKPNLNFSEPMTDGRLNGQVVFVEPLKETRSLLIVWEMPPHLAFHLESKPDQIIAHLLGHEGPKSLYAQLQREQLATSVAAGATHPSRENSFFVIKIELTKKGLSNFHTVVTRVFQAIHTLKTHGIPSYVFDEIQKMETIKFQYPSKQEVFDDVLKNVANLRDEPLDTYPLKTKIIQKFDSNLIQQYLDYLTPKHAQFVIIAPSKETKIKNEAKEPWLQVPYAVRPVPAKVLNDWIDVKDHPDIDNPSPNEFIPQHLQFYYPRIDITKRVSRKKLIDSDRGTLFFAPDEQYGTPKVSWILTLITPKIDSKEPSSSVHGDLMVQMLKEALNPWGYSAQLAGMRYEISRHPKGITISIEGYNENALKLLEEIITTMNHLSVSGETFDRLKESLQKEYKNFSKKPPLQRGMEGLKNILYEVYVTEAEKSQALREVTADSMKRFLAGFGDKIYIEAFLYGNMKEDQAQLVWHNLMQTYQGKPYPKSEQPLTSVALLPQEGGPFILESSIPSSGNALLLAIEQENYSIRDECIQEIAVQMMTGYYFSSLRTKQQTGYIVGLVAEEIEKLLVTIFVVESHTHDPEELLARTERVIEAFLSILSTNNSEDEKKFEAVRLAKIEEMEAVPKNLIQMGKRLYQLAFKEDENFAYYQEMAQAYRSLTFADFVKETKNIYGRDNKRRLAIFVRGKIIPEAQFKYNRVKAPWLKEHSLYRNRIEN